MNKIGITFSGGGMMGVAHLGVLKALHHNGICPDIVAGTSMGSIIGGLYASGLSVEEIISIFYSIDNNILDIDYWGIISSLLHKKLPMGFIKGFKIEKMLYDKTSGINIKDVSKMLAIVSANLDGGENVIFTNSKINGQRNRIIINDIELSKAIRASISFPIAFQPVTIQDMYLTDGGIVNNCPINLCQEMGAEYIIVSNIDSANNVKLKNRDDFIEMTNKIISITVREANKDDFNITTVPCIRIPFFNLKNIPLLGISKSNINDAILAGYEDTCNMLQRFDFSFLKNK